jgi:hypothetical protein
MNQGIDKNRLSFKASRLVLGGIVLVGMLGIGGIFLQGLIASDHDDGETDTKTRNLGITDLYVFRESEQNPGASQTDLVFVLNTNPRSVARQQYYFNPNAQYEFRIARVGTQADNNKTPTGETDITLRFEFSPPDANRQQRYTLTAIRDGQTFVATNLVTTPIPTNPSSAPTVNQTSLGGSNISVFAGLREDPFFFDVEQYFRVRAGALGIGPVVGFRSSATAIDFAKGYNVNAIVARIPVSFLRGRTRATTFDVWARIFAKNSSGNFVGVERIGRPAINEGLVFTNDFLNALNGVGPLFEARALKGINPEANIAAPIVAEVIQTLKAFGNSTERANTLVAAFLPDVMRIDTLRPSGYGTFLNANGSPAAGRLLRDDTIDTTLQVVTNNPAAGDNVSYEGTPGNPSQGHHPLATSFPYLAPAN